MSDPWAREWQVFSWRDVGGPKIGKGKFTLLPVEDDTHTEIAYYRVVSMSPEMPAYWSKVRFFPRGSDPAKGPSAMLPKWTSDPGIDQTWDQYATAVRHAYTLNGGSIPGLDPAVERLEGDIYPAALAEALTLIRVNRAAEDGDVLILVLKSRQGERLYEDGTAHGGTPH